MQEHSLSPTAIKFKKNKVCVVIPTYKNAIFLSKLLDSVLVECSDVIVVNDGSPDNTLEVLKPYSNIVTIISFEKNRGKGKALQAGFKKAFELGFLYAVTMDSDNQHKASDLHLFADAIENNQGTLIVGARKLEGKQLSKGSEFANKFSNFWFTVHTLKKIKDTQTGYRLYPVSKIKNIRLFTSRYETELELLVRSVWRGIPVKSLDIDVFYPSVDERVSSFRPARDFARISILNTFFTFAAFVYGYPSMLFHWLIKTLKV